MMIGATDRAITIGPVAGTASQFGLFVDGKVEGLGVYSGVNANGLLIGGRGGAVTIANGMGIAGTVSANSNGASATALRFGAGASVPQVHVSGTVSAAGGNAATAKATAIQIDHGAAVATLRNSGTIKAVAAGRPFAISYGGVQDMQYVGDVAALFLKALADPFEGAEAYNLRGAVTPIETFAATFRSVVPESAGLVTHGDRQLPIASDLDDTRLEAAFGPLPRTPLAQGILETYRRFVGLREQGRLDLSDLT